MLSGAFPKRDAIMRRLLQLQKLKRGELRSGSPTDKSPVVCSSPEEESPRLSTEEDNLLQGQRIVLKQQDRSTREYYLEQ